MRGVRVLCSYCSLLTDEIYFGQIENEQSAEIGALNPRKGGERKCICPAKKVKAWSSMH